VVGRVATGLADALDHTVVDGLGIVEKPVLQGGRTTVEHQNPGHHTGDDVLLADLIERWSDKYPAVPVITSMRRSLDAAVVLCAATSDCGLAVAPYSADARTAALLLAVSRRARCPLVLVGGEATQSPDEGIDVVLMVAPLEASSSMVIRARPPRQGAMTR
jgi:hypothetical protein